MAKKVVQLVEFIDDMDGSEVSESDIETIAFTWDGAAYEIDLKPANAKKFAAAVKPYVDSARRARRGSSSHSGGSSRRAGGGSGRSKDQLQAIRDWATSQGYEVAPRGRIKAEVIEAFDAAH